MNDTISKIVNRANRVSFSVGVIAFGTGIGLGYLLGKRGKGPSYHVIPAQTDFDHDAVEDYIQSEKEVKEGRDFVQEKIKETVVIVPEPLVYEETERELITSNVFAGTDDEWDYEEEVKNRATAIIYVIHKDEFYANEFDFTQTTLTYYAGDNVLVDEDNTPIYNHNDVVGELKFGHGSGDPNVFHVRNQKNKAEYEIINDPGLYTVEVLGLSIEDNDRVKGLQHSHDRVRKFKQE